MQAIPSRFHRLVVGEIAIIAHGRGWNDRRGRNAAALPGPRLRIGPGDGGHIGLLAGAQFDHVTNVGLHRSTLRKVDVLANMAERAQNQQLLTNTSWWQMHGGRVRTAIDRLSGNKLLLFGLTLAGVIIGILTLR